MSERAPVADFHRRVFSTLADAVPGLLHLHYGVSHMDDRPLIGGLGRLRRGPLEMLELLVEAGQLDELPEGSQGLDVGCGLGGTCMVLAEELGHQMVGINITPEQVQRGQALVQAAGLEEWVQLRHGDAVRLPLEDESVDFAVMVECAFHVQDKAALFSELARVLRPGGRVVLADQDRRDGDEEVMGLFFFPAVGRYAEHARAAGLWQQAEWDLSPWVANWMSDYARSAALPFHLALVGLCLLRLRPGLGLDYLRGVRHFNRLIGQELQRRGLPERALSNNIRRLREHTRQELDDGVTSYKIWRFDKPGPEHPRPAGA